MKRINSKILKTSDNAITKFIVEKLPKPFSDEYGRYYDRKLTVEFEQLFGVGNGEIRGLITDALILIKHKIVEEIKDEISQLTEEIMREAVRRKNKQ